MSVDIDKLKELMKERANGNFNQFARDMEINVSLLYKVLTKQFNPGTKTISKIVTYLKRNGLKIEDYIFLG